MYSMYRCDNATCPFKLFSTDVYLLYEYLPKPASNVSVDENITVTAVYRKHGSILNGSPTQPKVNFTIDNVPVMFNISITHTTVRFIIDTRRYEPGIYNICVSALDTLTSFRYANCWGVLKPMVDMTTGAGEIHLPNDSIAIKTNSCVELTFTVFARFSSVNVRVMNNGAKTFYRSNITNDTGKTCFRMSGISFFEQGSYSVDVVVNGSPYQQTTRKSFSLFVQDQVKDICSYPDYVYIGIETEFKVNIVGGHKPGVYTYKWIFNEADKNVTTGKYLFFYIALFSFTLRNFRGKKILRILRVCLEFAKLNSRENFKNCFLGKRNRKS